MFFTIVNRSRFWLGPNTGLSKEINCAPLENMKASVRHRSDLACESPLFESEIVRQQERWTVSDAVDQKVGEEKLEDRFCFRILVQHEETRLGLCLFDLHLDARD